MTTRLKDYEYCDHLRSLYDYGHSIILYDSKIQDGMMHVYMCHTTSRNPWCIKTSSDYIILPSNTPAGLYNSIYSPKTFHNVIF